MHLTPKQEVDIIAAFTIELIPAVEIAKQHSMTRQGVYKVLKRNQVDVSASGKVIVSCLCCRVEMKRFRCQVRKSKRLFCSIECYYAYLEAAQGKGPYIQNRHGQRIARELVSEHFSLMPSHIVHHEDRNCLNNQLDNLTVFANQGDHTRHHRGHESEPIWTGSELV